MALLPTARAHSLYSTTYTPSSFPPRTCSSSVCMCVRTVCEHNLQAHPHTHTRSLARSLRVAAAARRTWLCKDCSLSTPEYTHTHSGSIPFAWCARERAHACISFYQFRTIHLWRLYHGLVSHPFRIRFRIVHSCVYAEWLCRKTSPRHLAAVKWSSHARSPSVRPSVRSFTLWSQQHRRTCSP